MILMFGDVHGHFDHVLPAVQAEKPAAIIFLGDIQAQRPLEQELADVMELTEVYWIPGNHDTDSWTDYNNLFGSALADRNLHGRVVEIEGLKVAGLGGIFREKIWWPDPIEAVASVASYAELERNLADERANQAITNTKTHEELLKHRSTIFHDEWLRLLGQQADILVTHEAPSCHPHGFKAIDVLAQSMGVKFTFHGHHHDRINYASQWDRLGFSAYGVGLWGVTDMYGGLIAPGMLDARIKRFPVE